MELSVFQERKAKVYASALEDKGELSSSVPVFYNPKMFRNRDITLCVINAYHSLTKKPLLFLEPLAASGIRGIRVALECKGILRVVVSDKRKTAYSAMVKNIELNKVGDNVLALNMDANLLMSYFSAIGFKFDFIDIDPFGSPIYYVESALRALKVGGVLAVTATDLGPLCGVNLKKCRERYGILSCKTEYKYELGLRTLITVIIQAGLRSKYFLEPILSYYERHYYRVFFLSKKLKRSMHVNSLFMHVIHCPNCQERYLSDLTQFSITKCFNCGNNKLRIIGPLWTGRLSSRDLLDAIMRVSSNSQYLEDKKTFKLLKLLIEENNFPPFYFDIHFHCSRLKISPPKTLEVLRELNNLGYRSSRTHFSETAIKTNANLSTLQNVLVRLS